MSCPRSTRPPPGFARAGYHGAMRSRSGLALLLLLGLAACRSPEPSAHADELDEETRIVSRTPPPEPAGPRRFELVETAVLASGTDPGREVEISLPIASTDAGVQEVDSLLVRITPDQRYEIVEDREGNRRILVHAKGAGVVSCELTYEVARFPVKLDLSREEDRPLSEIERKLFVSELAPVSPDQPERRAPEPHEKRVALIERETLASPTNLGFLVNGPLGRLRRRDVPARVVTGLRLQASGCEAIGWFEGFVPGLGWVPFEPFVVSGLPVGECPIDRVALSRGSEVSVPAATSAGKMLPLEVSYRWREARTR